MSANDGGPAFPTPTTEKDAGAPGMSLRDYFAAHASHNDLHLPTVTEEVCKTFKLKFEEAYERHWSLIVSRARYRYADAMLAAREAGGAQ